MAEQVSSLRTGIKYKNTPIGKIPVDWELVQLGDICEEIYRYPTYYNIKYVEQDGVPEVRGELIRINGELSSDPSEYRYISKETSANFPRTILHEGDFVLSVRGTMGKIGYISSRLENANMTANLMRISPDRIKVYPLWLKQFLLSDFFQKRLEEASSATTIKTIKAPELKAIELPLPLLSEQKKIAEILTTMDEAIEKTSQIIEKTKEAKKGLMQRLFTRGIGHKKFKKTEIGEIPVEWEVGEISNYGEILTGNTPPTNVPQYYGNEYPFVSPFDLGNKRIIRKTEKYLSKEGFAVARALPANSVLVVCIGSTIGKTGIAGTELATNQQINSIICKNSDYNFVYYYATFINQEFKQLAGTQAVPILNKGNFSKVKVAIPPLSEQNEIGGILSAIDDKIEKELDHKAQLESLKKGLMQVLLTGKIRVL